MNFEILHGIFLPGYLHYFNLCQTECQDFATRCKPAMTLREQWSNSFFALYFLGIRTEKLCIQTSWKHSNIRKNFFCLQIRTCTLVWYIVWLLFLYLLLSNVISYFRTYTHIMLIIYHRYYVSRFNLFSKDLSISLFVFNFLYLHDCVK